MKKLQSVIKKTNNKHLNLYDFNYSIDEKQYVYEVCSRRNIDDLAINNKKIVDAVKILPYFRKVNEFYVVLIKEFRRALNRYIWGVPAGLVENGENTEETVKRELKEEIGASVISLNKVLNSSPSSAGMTDESLECFEAEIVLDDIQHLDGFEDITLFELKLDDILDFIDTHEFDLASALLLKIFYYKNKENKNGKEI